MHRILDFFRYEEMVIEIYEKSGINTEVTFKDHFTFSSSIITTVNCEMPYLFNYSGSNHFIEIVKLLSSQFLNIPEKNFLGQG